MVPSAMPSATAAAAVAAAAVTRQQAHLGSGAMAEDGVGVGGGGGGGSMVAEDRGNFEHVSKGSMLLRRMGWTEGQGLGRRSDGKLQPIQARVGEVGGGAQRGKGGLMDGGGGGDVSGVLVVLLMVLVVVVVVVVLLLCFCYIAVAVVLASARFLMNVAFLSAQRKVGAERLKKTFRRLAVFLS